MNEVVIYYPYYELEKDNLIPKPNHILNVKIFLLLADKLLIPPSHLHDARLEYIQSLNGLHKFIDNNSIVTSVGQSNHNLKEYFFQKKYEHGNWDKREEYKASEVIELFSNVDSFRKRDRIKQSYFFYEYLKDLLLENSEEFVFSKRKTDILHNEIEKILDRKGYMISKTDFNELILRLKKSRKLNNIQFKTLRDFSNSAYYYAGCVGNKSHIGYSSYFQNIQISKFNSELEFGPILYYDPHFFIKVLNAIGIIDNENDIVSLSYNQINEIRQHKGFRLFIAQYNKLSKICQQSLDDSKYASTVINKIERKMKGYKWGISYSTFIATVGLLGSSNPFLWTIYVLTLLEGYIGTLSFSKKFFNKSIDKIRIKMTERIDPFTSFCLKLENIFDENK